MAPKKTVLKPKPTAGLTEQPETKLSKSSQFPIVGVGASAGGLEAFTQLFKNLPADPGMAFVLIQHLAPAHESMLTELLSKATSMPVREVKDGMTVEPDNVYVIPPDSEMVIFQGVLHLTPREKTRGQYMPVDSFLRSLAQDRRNNAIAVILSGSGTDGSTGVRAVKGEGGIVFAQDETAKYDGMPKSALDTGCVDFVLPADKISAELLRIRRHPYLTAVRRGEPEQVEQLIPAQENDLNKIFIMLRSAKGVDFASYKRSTIMRRVTRRMLLQKIEGMEKYIAYLKENPSEIETLYQDVLINVTSFFREPEAFEALKRSVFPHIVNKAAGDVPVRIWVPACSTGEEAYSIAIALVEYMDENKISRPVQLFATDIDDIAVEKARKGIYPENISRDVSPERLKRFFEKTGGGYAINKFVREMCIFAKQNMVKDPPFSKIDLISCRNVLIYFSQELQKKAVRILFYALNPKGFLMIGPSETVGEFAGLFSIVDKKNTIYAKKAEQSGPYFGAPAVEYEKERSVAKKTAVQPAGIFDIQKEADTIVLTNYSPAGFVVSENLKILQFRGDTGPYLRPAPGEASLDLLKMVSEDLVAELRTALHQAKKEDVPVRKERSRLKQDKRIKYINIDVVPFKAPATGERCFLVLFEETGKSAIVGAGLKGNRGGGVTPPVQDEETKQLRQELTASKAHLNTVTQEYEAANEELRALNEELQSSNEEMQSVNEEMETAREELQSTNEELTTVNDELQSRNEETTQLNNDLFNVLRGVEIPIIILGSGLQVRRFNDAAARLLNLIPTDTGRPLSNIRTNINIPDLEQMVLDVVNTLAVKVKEVQDMEGRWYSLTIRPYKTVDSRIAGVLMTLVDVDNMKRNLLKIKAAYDYANAIVETVREPLLILDSGLRVITANRSFYENFLATPEETVNRFIYDLGDHRWNIPALRELLEKVLPEPHKSFSDYEIELELPNIGRKVMILNARKIYLEEPYFKTALNMTEHFDRLILLTIADITERKKIEDAQLFLVQSGWVASGEDFFKSLAQYLAVNLGMDYVCIDRLQGAGLSAETVAVYFNGKFEDNVSYTLKDTPCGDVAGKTICSFPEGVRHLYPKDVILQEMLAESYVGTTLWSSGGQPIGLIAIIGRKPLANPQLAEQMLRMVSVRAAGELERRQAEEALQASSDRYRSYIEVPGALGWTTNANGEVVEDIPSWRTYTGQTYKEVEGHGWSKAVHPEDIGNTLQVWEEAVRGKINYEVEYRIRRHDGIYRHFMVHGTPVLNEDGTVREWVGTCIDITERKKNEEALKTLNQELQSTASELEAAYRDMESFSYSVSHDLRAPLRIIDGLSDVVLKDYHDKLDNEGKNILKLIQGNTKRMDQLVLALLAFSKAGRQEMSIDEINMEKAAALIAGDLKAISPERNINMDIRELPPAHGDITLIRQVLTNLLSNAVKFTKDRDIATIEVGGRREDSENVYYVKDNGAGFDIEYADKLFKVFQRLHSLKEFEGIGIGLSIVDRIIRRHGGKVWAEGKPDEGATFYFTLPNKKE